ncbi:hypothetical protein F4818DRAFT_440790 [Hypoxylon cercidicola]|nr:hypothetical protein F4818DRAFT_440790 [Hypoxylon cercidicola]
MSSPGPTLGLIWAVRARQYSEDSEGTRWTRRINSDGTYTAWELESQPEPEASFKDPNVYLFVVQVDQSPGEPLHWFLFVGSEENGGSVYQVEGDATYMYYQHAHNVDIWSSAYRNSYQLCKLDQNGQELVNHYANNIPPPRAEKRSEVTENCQGWAVRVLRELQSAGIVDEGSVDSIENLVEPIR